MARERLHIFDLLRGIDILSMVAFHLCYDVVYVMGWQLGWYSGSLVTVWRDTIAWPFLFIAGCMCAQSRDNLRRSGKYLAVALLIYVVTALTEVVTPISFGIIFCMGACTLIEWLLERAGAAPRGAVAGVCFVVAFLALLQMNWGYLDILGMRVELPRAPYELGWLSWLGFPGPDFASGDYYPVLPYLLMYLAGTSFGRKWAEEGYPDWCFRKTSRPLEFIGRHTLAVYVLHQPILIAVLLLVAGM
jgi:uncharacterized membrane protein